jgi:hypothetical protein
VFYRLGNLTEAAQASRRTYDDGIKILDLQCVAPAISAWAKARAGDIPEEVLRTVESAVTTFDLQSRLETKQARAVALMYSGQPDAAAQLLEDAWLAVRSAGILQEYVAAVAPWLLTARRMILERAADSGSLGNCFAAAKKARRVARRYANNRAHVHRELARVEIVRNRYAHAYSLLEESRRSAEKLGMQYELAQTELVAAALDRKNGVADSVGRFDRACAVLAKMDARVERLQADAAVLYERRQSL